MEHCANWSCLPLECFILAPQLIHKGNINFLVFDYLSEITMSLLTAAKQKIPVSILNS